MGINRQEPRRHFRHDILLPVLVIAMMAVAAFAAVNLVLHPVSLVTARVGSGSSNALPSSAVSTAAPSSSAAVSSSAASSPVSSAVRQGSYADFTSAVFIGDSLTMGIDEYSITKCGGVFATNGLSTSGALTQKFTTASGKLGLTDAVKQVGPDRIYILLGANDITWMSAKTFTANYGKLIDTLRTVSPNATYYVQSIFPVTVSYEKKTGITNDKINTFNEALTTMCAGKGAKYVDVGAQLRGGDGKLLPDAAADGYNIKNAYYMIWLDYLVAHE